MRELSAPELLSAWERGMRLHAVERALLLLAAAFPDLDYEEIACWPVGRRDGQLLALRAVLFGTQLTGSTSCPACGERLELNLNASELQGTATAGPDPAGAGAEELSFTTDGYEIRYRLPNSLDLLALGEAEDSDAAYARLLGECVIEARCQGAIQPAEALPAPVIQALAEQMDRADPLANIWLDLSCPGCGHQWQPLFDIATFIWTEVDAWAQRTLREVADLASWYGWREADILEMSAWRRRFYLEMAGR